MKGFGERLRARARELGMSDAEVARQAGLSARRYANYVANDREPDLSTLIEICKVLRVTPDWALGLADEAPPPATLTPVEDSSIVSFSGDDYAAIARYDVQAAAGYGRLVEQEQIVHRLLFRMEWLRSITRAPLDQLGVIEIDGDSMEPTLRSGDSALLDLLQRHPGRKDGLYALRMDGGLQVKRVSAHPQSRLLSIRSDNPAYPSYDNIDPAAIDVVARVIWIGRRI